jgi:hypothetical protein
VTGGGGSLSVRQVSRKWEAVKASGKQSTQGGGEW